MEYVVVILIALGILYLKTDKKTSSTKPTPAKNTSTTRNKNTSSQTNDIPDWLLERWSLANQQKLDLKSWYFDEPTQKQLDKLKQLNQKTPHTTTKGMASDLIGLHFPADDDDLEILKFFKVKTSGLSQTKAKHETGILLNTPENKTAFENRPATTIQKEYFKHFDLKGASGLTHNAAALKISEHRASLPDEDPKEKHWEILMEIVEELSDKENLESHDIKKPSFSLIKQAVLALIDEGVDIDDTPIDVVEKIIELNPSIQRA